MSFVVLNKSTLVTPAEAAQMTQAVASQLWWQAAPAWGRKAPAMRLDSSAGKPGEWVINILDTPDQADALGWHTEDPGGKVYGNIFAKPVFDAGGDACSRELSVSSVLSHEALETMFDWTVNLWADDGYGTLWSYEVCDPCEADSYPIVLNGARTMVSNFVLPSFFDGASTGKVDWLGTCAGPFLLAARGYAVTIKTIGQPSQIFGAHYDSKLTKIYG